MICSNCAVQVHSKCKGHCPCQHKEFAPTVQDEERKERLRKRFRAFDDTLKVKPKSDSES